MLQFFYVIQNHREEEYIWKDEAWACISGFTSLNFSFSNLKELYISLIYVSTQILRHSWIEQHLTIFWQKVHFLGQILDYKGQIMSKFELNGTKKPSTEIETAPFYLRRYSRSYLFCTVMEICNFYKNISLLLCLMMVLAYAWTEILIFWKARIPTFEEGPKLDFWGRAWKSEHFI